MPLVLFQLTSTGFQTNPPQDACSLHIAAQVIMEDTSSSGVRVLIEAHRPVTNSNGTLVIMIDNGGNICLLLTNEDLFVKLSTI